ncbi:Glycosyltransferase involved in cell wall bisynthesis [Loktanella fryxellensis]|uniref:Glycosyltransferase involved in cell wall bisynthesis n=1 Tax=Loktanella fryxellensis TaxID=245187 RepID=A0A1H7ZLE8_9RHOB|nr:glycosyltransferase family 4 protein [Loktanella fryxellensis]SEM58754.1 Glycosyltransferase involved in cell wall bisynthesis [Loktanella fryxellensis]
MTALIPGPIGYVVKRYPRYSETFIVNEILAHEAAGTRIEIFALRSVEESHFQDILGQVKAPVTRIRDKYTGPDAIWTMISRARDTLSGAWAALERLEGLNGQDIVQAIDIALHCHARGIVHLHAHFGTVSTSVARGAAALAGIGYSFTAHAKDIFCDYAENQFLDLKLRDATTVVTVSDFNVDYLHDRFGANAGQVMRIYNGLDLNRFTHMTPGPDATGILAVGRLVEKKGFHILIEALRLLAADGRTVPCTIVGSGEEADNLSRQIAAAGLTDSVTLAGPLPQGEVFAAMRRAAVLACPCVVGGDGNRDGLPTVLLEAMALGLPCVATDVTGIPELVRHDETGLIATEGDPETLADALGHMLDDADLRRRFSDAGRARVEADFDVAVNAARLRDVFAAATAPNLQGVA